MTVLRVAQSLAMLTLLLARLELVDCFTPGIEKCDPALLPRLPPRMRAICHSLLKTIEEYDEELSALQRPPALEYFLSENKRKEPDHVFLRFG